MSKKKVLIRFILLFFGFIFFKILVCDLYYVPTESMENTISRKSYIVVSKLHYGAMLPNNTNEIPYLSKVTKKMGVLKLWNNIRAFGLEDVRRGDIVLAANSNTKIVKRVTGMPKDTISVKNGFLIFNDCEEKILNTYKYEFIVNLNRKSLDTIKRMVEDIIYIGKNNYSIKLNGALLKLLKHNQKKAISIDSNIKFNDSIFPESMIGKWTKNNYGPVIVPYKNFRLKLNEMNYSLYHNTIKKYENKNIEYTDSKYYIDQLEIKDFVFTKDYFFLMGDNRMNSLDSRYIGFIPESKIFGKVIYSF